MEKHDEKIKYSFNTFDIDLSQCDQCGGKYSASKIDLDLIIYLLK